MAADMQAEADAGKKVGPDPARHPYGPRPVGALLPAVTRPAFRKRSPATASLLLDWAAIVGPHLATITHPRRFSGGTLTLGCAGPVALELQHEAGVLIERINAHLGRPMVVRLRFVQEAAPGLLDRAARRRRPRLDPVAIDNLPDGPLRDALAALGAVVLADRA